MHLPGAIKTIGEIAATHAYLHVASFRLRLSQPHGDADGPDSRGEIPRSSGYQLTVRDGSAEKNPVIFRPIIVCPGS